jgi:hypothetical protein
MSVAQVAQVLRKTKIHVKVLLFRARQLLAREMTSSHTPQLLSSRSSSRTAAQAASTPA